MRLSESKFRKILYTNTVAKKIFGLIKGRSFSKFYDFNHLSLFDTQRVSGAIFRDEALFMYSLIKIIRPRVVVEFGLSRGHSTLNFLNAIDKDAKLYSFDISDSARMIAKEVLYKFKNFYYCHKSQLDFSPEDVYNQKIDLVYFDAVYNAELNLATFEKIKPSLNEGAILMLHDTNTWPKSLMDDSHIRYASKKSTDWLNENEFQPQKGQREFYNEFIRKFPDYSGINLHSTSTLLSGVSLLQKKSVLLT